MPNSRATPLPPLDWRRIWREHARWLREASVLTTLRPGAFHRKLRSLVERERARRKG